MAKYPIFLELNGCMAVVVGGSTVALRKLQVLLDCGAKVKVVAKQIDDDLTELCKGRETELIKAPYRRDYLAGALLVVAATNDNQLNRQIYQDCRQLGILCNVVDVPELCDFFVPAVVKRDRLQIAIGTDGLCPAYARRLREELEQIITDKNGEFLSELGKVRCRIIEQIAEPAERQKLLRDLTGDESFECFCQKGPIAWRDYAAKVIAGQ
ncbi:MAG: precorrin-2 dehydrogenase/sirohydrochlorin ferrochelatase family protein [Planctomycetota bacterium]|jgi:precorrin-2 dehydrogenase/sirohydrochlorin ferrochelatase